jgi:hypothetical protein
MLAWIASKVVLRLLCSEVWCRPALEHLLPVVLFPHYTAPHPRKSSSYIALENTMTHINNLVQLSAVTSATTTRDTYKYYQKRLLLLLLLLLYLDIRWFIFKLIISSSLFTPNSLTHEHEQFLFRYFWQIFWFLLSESCDMNEENWKCKHEVDRKKQREETTAKPSRGRQDKLQTTIKTLGVGITFGV